MSEIILITPNSILLFVGMTIDWGQVVLDLFTTFLGFVLAILSERITDKLKERQAAKELQNLLAEELEKILIDLEKFNKETLDVTPLKIPSWNSAINTGQLSLLDFDTRKILFGIYNTIIEFNSWCLIHTNYYFEHGEQNKLLKREIDRIRNELLNNSSKDILNIKTVLGKIRGDRNGN